MGKKLIITAALCGAGTMKSQTPYVPVTPEEIAEDAVACAKAGASIIHIHVRDEEGKNTMEPARFIYVMRMVQAALDKEGLTTILNPTTSGSKFPEEWRLGFMRELSPEMCSYDPNSMNWANSYIFKNEPSLLEHLGTLCQELNCKPECEIFDGGFCTNVAYYVKKGFLTNPVHCQLVLGVSGAMPGTVESVSYLTRHLPEGATWSITGIGHSHMPMMLAGLAAGCDGLRVGLEDNIYLEKGVLATNVQLVERACKIGIDVGREIATPEDTRAILGLKGRAASKL